MMDEGEMRWDCESVTAPLDSLSAPPQALTPGSLCRIGGRDLLAVAAQVERVSRLVQAAQLVVADEINAQGVAQTMGITFDDATSKVPCSTTGILSPPRFSDSSSATPAFSPLSRRRGRGPRCRPRTPYLHRSDAQSHGRPPASWCDGHHVTTWAAMLGRTSIHNGALLCAHHHSEIHGGHWQMRMNGGRPEFLPPIRVDPDQTWRRNNFHHLHPPDLKPPAPDAADAPPRTG